MQHPMGRSIFLSVLTILIVNVLVASCSGDDSDGSLGGVGVEFSAIDLADPKYLQTRELLENEIGIDGVRRVEELVTSHAYSVFPYVNYRTHTAEMEEQYLRAIEIDELSDEEQQDLRFDTLVSIVLDEASTTRRGNIARGSGQLHDAYTAGLQQCARSHGISNVEDMMRPSDEELPFVIREQQGGQYRRSVAEYERHAASLGFTREELLDVRHSCSRYAAELPALEPELRAHLLGLLHQHYLEAVLAWLKEDPEALASLEVAAALDPAHGSKSPGPTTSPRDGSTIPEDVEGPAGDEPLEGISGSVDAASADRPGPLRFEPGDGIADGSVDLGYRFWPDRYALKQHRDEVTVRVDSVLVRDGVLRGLVQNMSRGLFARGVTVSVGTERWVFPLTVQPTEVVPFSIEGYDGPADLEIIEFEVTANLTRAPDLKRSLYISGFPGLWAEPWGDLKNALPEFVNDRPPRGTTDDDFVFYYETGIQLAVPSSHPSIADEVMGQTIDDLRVYLTKLDHQGRVLEVHEMIPYMKELVYIGDGSPELVFTAADRLPLDSHNVFLVRFLTDESPFAFTAGGVYDGFDQGR